MLDYTPAFQTASQIMNNLFMKVLISDANQIAKVGTRSAGSNTSSISNLIIKPKHD